MPETLIQLAERAARLALFETEMARTGVVNPVNGSRSYSYVTFHGQTVRFDEGEWEISGDAGTAQAAAYAGKINDALFELAKKAARLALEASFAAKALSPASIESGEKG